MKKLNLTWKKYGNMCEQLAGKLQFQSSIQLPEDETFLYGIPRGGVIVANILSYMLDFPVLESLDDALMIAPHNIIIVDDISDTGDTFYKCVVKWNKRYVCYMNDNFSMKGKQKFKIISAALILNQSSKYIPDFFAYINRENQWVNFPYDRERDTISKVRERI